MAHTASNSNHSPVSCLNSQALESLSPFHFIFLPTLSPNWAKHPNGPTGHMFRPPLNPPGQRLPRSFLFASVTKKHSHFVTQTYTCVLSHTETGFSFILFFLPICGFFFLFAENANKRKTRFSIEGTSLLQYEDINWIGRIPHAVVSKVLWQLTEWHLETQELGFVWGNFPTRVVSKGKWMWEKGEDSWGGAQKEKRKECHWRGRKWNAALFLPSTSFPSFLWMDDSRPLKGELRLLLVPQCMSLCLHFRWTSPFRVFIIIIIFLVSHSILNMLLSLRNKGWLLGTGPVYSSLM